jgi:Protein of unknown function (DUF2752)
MNASMKASTRPKRLHVFSDSRSRIALLGIGVTAARLIGADDLSVGVTCPLRRFTGIPCPLCGGTSAAVAFTRGHLMQSLTLSPPFVLLVMFVLFPWLPEPWQASVHSFVTQVKQRVSHRIWIAMFVFALAIAWIWQLRRLGVR